MLKQLHLCATPERTEKPIPASERVEDPTWTSEPMTPSKGRPVLEWDIRRDTIKVSLTPNIV